MGLAWWMPDTETPRGFFKFLPRNYLDNQQHLSETEIVQLEKMLLKDQSTGGLANASELIRLRELQKDHILKKEQNDKDLLAVKVNLSTIING